MPDNNTRILDLKDIMRHEHGRRFIWTVLQDTKVFENGFSSDPYVHAYTAGLRQYGVDLNKELISEMPAFYDMMLQESRIAHVEESRDDD